MENFGGVNQPKLIELKKAKRVVFVGDTHGDLEASQKIVKNFLKKENIFVFLGDYVDRGPYSKKNLDFLLNLKVKFPSQIFLLQGNHEGYKYLKHTPADFWEGLSEKEFQKYSSLVEMFPLAVVYNDIIALHGALPDMEDLKQINQIEPGSKEWFQICWGDFVDQPGGFLGTSPFTGRPQFGQDYFLKLMARFKKKILIRSHQPNSPQFMFDDRCLTIFTSSAYSRERTIAIMEGKVESAKDLKIIRT